MKGLKEKSSGFFKKYYPILAITLVVVVFFWKFFLKGLIPIPADMVVGAYFPWLDYKWGYEIGVPVKNPITSDVVSVIYPLRSYAVDLIKRGELPLWNPLMFGGYPLLANFQVALFSPTFLLYLLLPKLSAWTGQVVLQPFLAALFSYLFLRHLKVSKFASAMGGLIYAFSGFNIIWLEWNAHALTAAWIPLILLLTSKFIKEAKIKWGVFLSVAVASQIFSGYPQLFIYTLLSIFLYLVVVLRRELTWKILFHLAFFILVGLSLTAIQTLPALELLINSQRVQEILSYDLTYLPWQNLISFLAPDYFGNHATGNFWGMGNYTNNIGYAGAVSLILASIGYFNFRKKREAVFLGLLLVFSLLFSLPFVWTKIFSGAYSMTRILVLANLAVAFLAAFGLEALFKKVRGLDISTALFYFLTLIIIAAFSFITWQSSADDNYLVGLRNLAFPAFFVGLTIVILAVGVKVKKLVKLSVVMVGLLAVSELFRFGWKYTPFSRRDLVFPETPVISFLKSQEAPFRFLSENVIPMNMWVPYGLESPSGYDAVYPVTWSKYLGVANKSDKNAPSLGRYAVVENYASPLIDMANNRYLLVLSKGAKELELEESGYKKVFEDKSVSVYENSEAFDRALLAFDWIVQKEQEKVFERLLDPTFALSRVLILEKDPGLRPKEILPMGDVSYRKYSPRESVLKTRANKDSLLFVSEVWYPGWEAFVDGNKTEILRANSTFRAVKVPEGEHEVGFIYDPKSFKIGGWLSIATLIFLSATLIYDKKKISQRPS
ncbi:MAG: hypothetical protein UX67_C0038G0007 [Candidatus Woesebacteria bacterium GW2011_GWF2_46_8]|uniref:Bacterial membrane protein YfhO n=2 Tax=Candidatus Woeseibacteriota TaxID=1752722 RepID=A0A0G1SZQ6_9BACT|nr:MAG: hypothetical protein UX67_C0038G0007 [Candidatus Woesebacteria bacterium GW2011_GWF2_46_8]